LIRCGKIGYGVNLLTLSTGGKMREAEASNQATHSSNLQSSNPPTRGTSTTDRRKTE